MAAQRKTIVVISQLVLAGLLATESWPTLAACCQAQKIAEPVPLAAPAAEPDIRAWVSQLSSREFAQRERASQALLEAGKRALPYLREAFVSDDLEVALRSKRIVAAIEVRLNEARRKAFLAAKNPGIGAPAGWDVFRDLVGDSEHTREFFLAMHEAEPDLMSSAEMQADDRLKMLTARVKLLYRQIVNQRAVATRRQSMSSFHIASLFLIASLDSPQDPSLVQQINQLVNYSDLRMRLSGARHRETIHKLLSTYIIHRIESRDRNADYYAATMLPIALNYNVHGVLPAAVRVLEEGAERKEANRTRTSAIMYAAMAIARFGSKEHVDLLTKHLSDDRVCSTWSVNGEQRETQVGDIALVMSLHILEEDPRDFGFDSLAGNSVHVYQSYSMSFANEESRKKSRDKWRTFRQGGSPPLTVTREK
ncbi:MAG: hypothetical protein MPJ50_12975 [Pirellulales bacterium]|nr:hypothetical protein [Pirellulales bacterium]